MISHMQLRQDDVWRHVKSGNCYRVFRVVRLEATDEPAILYQLADGTGPEWVRPLAEWTPDRFQLVKDDDT